MKSKKQRNKKYKKEDESYSKGLKIYTPDGKRLIFLGEPGFSLDYQQLVKQKKRKSKYGGLRRSY